MKSITCICGMKVEGANFDETEAKAWRHALDIHIDMLKGSSVQELEGIIKNNRMQMGKE